MKQNKYMFSILALSGLLAVTLFFRLYRLDIPMGINNDAAWEGSAARAILQGNWNDYIPYAGGWHGEMIIRVTIAALTLLFGNTPTTIRLASSLFGILLIPLLFAFLRKLFPATLAVLTSFFVATSGWHIIMSRSGWRAVTVPTLVTLAWYTLYQAATTRKRPWYMMTGCTLALTLYTYDAARVVPLIAIGIIVWMLSVSPSFRTRHAKGSPLFFLTFILISAPMLLYATIHWDSFIGRTTYLLVTHQITQSHSLQPLIDNVTTAAGLFTKHANGNDFFIDKPLLDPPVIWLFPIGCILSLWSAVVKKNRRQAFMLGWFFISLLPAVLSHPNGNRAIGAIPIVYFFAAYATITLANAVSFLIGSYQQVVRIIIIIYMTGFVTAASYISYIGPLRKEPVGFYPETYAVAQYLVTKLGAYHIYLTDNFPREILTYMLYTGGDPFKQLYTWYPKKEYMLTVPQDPHMGTIFVLFPTEENRKFTQTLIARNPGARQFILPVSSDILKREAAVIVEVPPKKRTLYGE